jgi:Ca2+-binding RTX toxin-like protein
MTVDQDAPADAPTMTITDTEISDNVAVRRGGGANDIVLAFASDDTVDGGPGIDLIFGGPGNDTLNGGPGNDLLSGEDGNDTLFGGSGTNTFNGGPGFDICFIPGNFLPTDC